MVSPVMRSLFQRCAISPDLEPKAVQPDCVTVFVQRFSSQPGGCTLFFHCSIIVHPSLPPHPPSLARGIFVVQVGRQMSDSL
jgi:hypothetical protein